MTDRKKIIKGLKCCLRLSNRYPNECLKCPYISDNDGEATCLQKIGKDALKLLKEQKPVKPFKEGINDYDCGRCGAGLRATDRYCANCGRMVKWND